MKNFKRTEQTLRRLMRKHGLSENGWTFGWNRHKRAYGICYYDAFLIDISECHVAEYNWQETLDTLLHEIAHGLTEKNCRSHGSEWKSNCRRIGGSATIYFYPPNGVDKVGKKNAPYGGKCTKCGKQVYRYRLRNGNRYAGCSCGGVATVRKRSVKNTY